jgi:REP-associated tyrosine transposase
LANRPFKRITILNTKKRRSIRLPEYNYSQAGLYHVTICVNQKENRLGRIDDGEMILNDLGRIAHQGWEWLQKTFQVTAVDVFCIMPNHIHAIIRIKPVGDKGDRGRGDLQIAPTTKPKPLGRLVGAYKTHTTIAINKQLNTPGVKFWQRNYYEHIIRNEREYAAVWNYIENNPVNWIKDEDYIE